MNFQFSSSEMFETSRNPQSDILPRSSDVPYLTSDREP